METLNFRPESFAGFEMEQSCGCDACKSKHSADEEFEFETARGWCKDLPGEVKAKDCFKVGAEERVLCKPGSQTTKCRPIPEVWHSETVGKVPFHYGAKTKKVGKRFELLGASLPLHGVKLVPTAWLATLKWTAMMAGFGMPLESVVHDGAGPYCRCVKSPVGVCGTKNPTACTGKTPSNHGTADAIDLTAFVWRSKELTKSAVKGTVVESWRDPEQALVLIRVNAALRLAYPTVIDYSDPNGRHDNHFHVDVVDGRKGGIFSFTEPAFVAGCLRRLGFSSATGKGTKQECFDALPGLARKLGMTVPSSTSDVAGWRAIIDTMYGCVAAGGASCKAS